MTGRKQKELLLIVLVLCFCTSCSKKDSQSNPPARTNEVVLKAPFDKVGDFSCGLGFVQMGQWVSTDDQVRQYFNYYSDRLLASRQMNNPATSSMPTRLNPRTHNSTLKTCAGRSRVFSIEPSLSARKRRSSLHILGNAKKDFSLVSGWG